MSGAEANREIRERRLPPVESSNRCGARRLRGIQLPEISAYRAALLREHGDLLTPGMRATLLAASLAPARAYVRAQQMRERIKRTWQATDAAIRPSCSPTRRPSRAGS
jgi:hypothetical protein